MSSPRPAATAFRTPANASATASDASSRLRVTEKASRQASPDCRWNSSSREAIAPVTSAALPLGTSTFPTGRLCAQNTRPRKFPSFASRKAAATIYDRPPSLWGSTGGSQSEVVGLAMYGLAIGA